MEASEGQGDCVYSVKEVQGRLSVAIIIYLIIYHYYAIFSLPLTRPSIVKTSMLFFFHMFVNLPERHNGFLHGRRPEGSVCLQELLCEPIQHTFIIQKD